MKQLLAPRQFKVVYYLYYNQYGPHYGQDWVVRDVAPLPTRSDKTFIYASGTGKVIKAGWDNVFGYCAAVVYPQCKVRSSANGTATYKDLAVRYYHMSSVAVTNGQSVTKDTKIGVIGTTGTASNGVHLHVEIDTDAREQYANYTPTLGKGDSNIMKKGTDSTINPSFAFYCKSTTPDSQSWVINQSDYNAAWCNSDDGSIKAY